MTAEKLAELFGTPSAGTLSLDTSKTVSYTHLDVYKRQPSC